MFLEHLCLPGSAALRTAHAGPEADVMTRVLLQRTREYAVKYFVCEALCLANVVLQLFFMDRFLGGEFLSYGTRVLELLDQEPHERVDPMAMVFPRLTKCQFQRYGPSGGIVTVNTLCLLPLNIVNEKTYVLLWFWMVSLAALLGALLLYRLLLCWALPLRLAVFRLCHRAVPLACADTLVARASLADWWLLPALASNVDALVFSDVVRKLVAQGWAAQRPAHRPAQPTAPHCSLREKTAASASAPEVLVELEQYCLVAA